MHALLSHWTLVPKKKKPSNRRANLFDSFDETVSFQSELLPERMGR
jgi:hypothetical protein